jgi:DNA-binding transcriptional regulator YiaG
MIEIVKELKRLMKEKEISPEVAARLMDISGRSIRRWLAGEFKPNFSSRLALKRGLRRIRKNL